MIYTLYSFKGGVGRSMALANLAECFCEKGLRVVMVDWDLEAPGLEAYFYPPGEGASPNSKLVRASAHTGLIDMLLEYKEKFPALARRESRAAPPLPLDRAEIEKRKLQIQEAEKITAEFLKSLTHVPEELRQVNFTSTMEAEAPAPLNFRELIEQNLTPFKEYLQPVHKSGRAELWLLTAGSRPREKFAEYANAVQDFDWIEFLAVYEGKKYLDWLRDKLNEFDVALIDSRTGVTEIGGVCTRQMADVVVSFCAPNFQNIDGVMKIVGSFDTEAAKKARNNRALQAIVIPTRVDDFESVYLAEFSNDFNARVEAATFIPKALQGLDRPLWNLQVPYIPKFNYREQLVIGPDATSPDPPTEKLIKAYRRIAVHMAALALEDKNKRLSSAYASEIATTFPDLQPQRPPQMAPTLPSNWVERPTELAELKGVLLDSSRSRNGGRLAVWGQAGMGKTSLVARACHDDDIRKAFPDGIVWPTLDRAWDRERIQDWLRTCFALPRKGGESALASSLENRRFLFVVDDVWNLDDLDAVFQFETPYTRLIITRDLAVASTFADAVVSVGMLTDEESIALLKISPGQVAESTSPAFALLKWPLGAALVRTELERRSALRKKTDEAWNEIRDTLKRQGITAFDQPEPVDRNGSVTRSLRETLGRLQPEERRLLISIAKTEDGLNVGTMRALQSTVERADPDTSRLRRLSDLGLISEREGVVRAHEIVYAWLLTQGILDAGGETASQSDRERVRREGYDILHGKSASLDETQKLAYDAKDLQSFSLARRLFALARQYPDAAQLPEATRLKLLQQQALCTYKDEDLPAEDRFSWALEILNGGDLLGSTPSQETLGLAGAIYKLRWKFGGQRRDLERSLWYYQRGAEGELTGDFGYTSINAAFVLDLLAQQEKQNAPLQAQALRNEATKLREAVAAGLPGIASQKIYARLKKEWWYWATLAEACFGLERHEEARFWLREGLALDPPGWELESTTRQLAALAHAQGADVKDESEAWRTLGILIGDADQALHTIVSGKVGLALSGGGFRASLFHIGVLARLAELDVLRHVEVLSCVSGGSIIGAHYYLEVRNLLQKKLDREITRQDYVDIVMRIERDFLAGVQKNLRTRLLAAWLANLRSIFDPGYTRTKYLGELFERHIYARVEDGERGKRWLNKLKIQPNADKGDEFNPKLDNWRRGAKAPILLLNATALNTGHNWQFAVNWMGEPPMGSSSLVDRNDLLRRMYYREAPARHQQIRLGHAVAASACVPALFEPLELHGLYPVRTVQLVDGGVYDNQGIAGLLEQECAVMIVSDASGQMNSERTPSGEASSVPMRSNSILQARVREAEFRELDALRRSSALTGLLFLHLKKDLEMNHVDWIGCQDPYAAFAEPGKSRLGSTVTSYGVPKIVQERLAGIRTDLDSFSDMEAYALMLSGYRMADVEFARCLPDFPANEAAPESWRFLAIEPTLDRAPDYEAEHERLQRLLSIGASRGFKVWRAWPALWVIALAAFLGALYASVRGPNAATLLLELRSFHLIAFVETVYGVVRDSKASRLLLELKNFYSPSVGTQVALFAFLFFVVLLLLRLLQRGRKSWTTMLSGLLMVTVGWVVARIHLLCFDPLYLIAGGVRRDPLRANSQRARMRRSS